MSKIRGVACTQLGFIKGSNFERIRTSHPHRLLNDGGFRIEKVLSCRKLINPPIQKNSYILLASNAGHQ